MKKIIFFMLVMLSFTAYPINEALYNINVEKIMTDGAGIEIRGNEDYFVEILNFKDGENITEKVKEYINTYAASIKSYSSLKYAGFFVIEKAKGFYAVGNWRGKELRMINFKTWKSYERIRSYMIDNDLLWTEQKIILETLGYILY